MVGLTQLKIRQNTLKKAFKALEKNQDSHSFINNIAIRTELGVTSNTVTRQRPFGTTILNL